MHIKSFTTKQFAGLRDKELEFKDSLNVVLGPNESGKSTLVNGIHSTMFKNIRLRNNNNADKDFRASFMPANGGDFIDGKLVIGTDKGDYEIYKEWGSSENIYLKTPEGNIVKDEKNADEILADILGYSESTYSNIVFAKQKKLKESIRNIIDNGDVTKEVSDILRKSLMELDGVSIDDIQNNINAEIDNLYKRWDREKNGPQNNRDINNPYKNGYGELLEAYYNYRRSEEDTKKAYIAEKNFENISQKINSARKDLDIYIKEKKELDEVREDVNKRQILETETRALRNEFSQVKDINDLWPRTEEQIKFLKKEEEKLLEENDSLNKEKQLINKVKRKNSIKSKIENIDQISKEIEKFEMELIGLDKVDRNILEEIENINKRLLEIEATLKAGNIIAELRNKSDREFYIQKNFNEEEIMKSDIQYVSDGFIKVYNDDFELEIKCGEVDYKSLQEEYNELKAKLNSIFNELKVESLEEAKSNCDRYSSLENSINLLKEKTEVILDSENIDDLKTELSELEKIGNIKEEDEINLMLKVNNDKQIDIKSNIKAHENQRNIWVEKYGNTENLFDRIIDLKTEINIKKSELDKLKPLPERFKTVHEFNERLRRTDENINRLNAGLDVLYNEFYKAKSELPENTFEELKKLYSFYKKDFDRKCRKGQKLLAILEVFNKTKERFDEDPMEPLIREFQNLLSIITAGSYKTTDIDEDFNISLVKDEQNMPIELLSAGTYDSVALALRFSILKYLFSRDGFVVLDDCLVDLDPERKKEAVNLIREFSKEYQIIFTTCDPETAEMLGGNLINM